MQEISLTQASGQTGASVGMTVVIVALVDVVVASVDVVIFLVVVDGVVCGPNGHKNGGGDKIHLQLDRS